ncbi:palmitoyltransferase ZDHHC11-like isoform X2 [Littorina saxatilis]|uniref:palmitoyltransferase ZDHHC11-like isoform X2 n=1 Tax=Littorina saxatilis TaxID=31220 RepID=UPI0038B53E7E
MAGQETDLSNEGSRRNGWSLPLHLLQLGGWLAVLYFMFIYFTTMVPALPAHWQPAAYIVNGLMALAIMVTMVTATTINPADPAVLGKMVKTVGRLDRSKHPHAILNQHCYLCQVNVGPKSKHCRACNKCIAEFDHHCKWLNNCVGGRNYKWFLSSLVAAALGTLLIVIVGLLEFVAYFVDKDQRDILHPYIVLKEENRGNDTAQFLVVYQTVSAEGWLTVTGITTVLAVVTLLLLSHLLFFHVWLWYKGLTTYEYIVRLREKEGYQDAETNKQSAASESSAPGTFRANKVTPSKTASETSDVGTKQKKSDQALEEYRRAMERSDQADGGETPPPLSSPIHLGADDKGTWSTSVKKLKKKKKKQDHTSDQQQVSTLVDTALYDTTDRPRPNALLPVQPKVRSKVKKGRSQQSPGSDAEECQAELSTERKAKKTKSGGNPSNSRSAQETESENVDLNSTQMFTLNSSAKLLPDGSLDYSDWKAFETLPLTPVSMRRQAQVPPLDLTALRSSNDSVLSSLNFQPYSATVRSTDTYRPNDRTGYRNLGSVPENVADMKV